MKTVVDFSGGKMNKDADSRYLPKGEYRHLENARVADTDDDNSGVIESLSGTELLFSEPLCMAGFKTIGMYSKDDIIFYFVCKKGAGTAVGMYDSVIRSQSYVLADLVIDQKSDDDGYFNTIASFKGGSIENTIFGKCKETGFGWYIPSRNELAEFCLLVGQGSYWSSTEVTETLAYMSDGSGGFRIYDKTALCSTVLIRRFYFEGEAKGSLGVVYKKIGRIAYEYVILPDMYPYGMFSYTFGSLLPFTEDTVLSGIHFYKGMLFFHDRNMHEPYKINIERTLENLNHYRTGDDMKVVKAPPPMPVISSAAREGDVENFRNIAPWFALRYEYEDGEMSAISAYSGAPFNVNALSDDELKDFTSLNMVVVSENNGRKFLSLFRSTDGRKFTPRTIQLKSNMEGNNIGLDSAVKMIYGCSAARDNSVITGSAVGSGSAVPFILTKDGDYYLRNGFTGFCTGTALNHDATNIIFAVSNGSHIQIHRLIKDGSYPKLKLVRVLNGGYGNYDGFIPASYMLHGAAMNYDGNICYVITSSEVWSTKNGGHTESDWELLADVSKIFPLAKNNEWKDLLHVCCSSDGMVVYVATIKRVGMSKDGGKTWKDYVFTGGLGDRINSISCSANGRRLFVGCRNFVYVSNNYGRDFVKASGTPDIGQRKYALWSVTCSDSGNIVYLTQGQDNAGRWDMNYPVYKSFDAGKNFTPITDPSVASRYPCDIFFSSVKNIRENLSDNAIANRITQVTIQYNTGSRHVKNIYLLMRSGAFMYKIARIPKAGLRDYTIEEYVFKNQGSYAQVPTKDVNKLYDNVPLRARTSKIIQNALMFGGYTDGKDSNISIDADIRIKKTDGIRGDISLKCNTVQSYGIVYYDKFNRSSSVEVIGEAKCDKLSDDIQNPRRVGEITIRHRAPEWADKYKIVRKDIPVIFYGINGFDGAYVYKGKIYLDVTNSTDIVPSPGDTIELIYEPQTDQSDNLGMELKVVAYEDIISGTGDNGLPRGRFIVVDEPNVYGYNKTDVAGENSYYESSYFYLLHQNSIEDSKVFLETPFEFEVKDGLHMGNVQDQTDTDPAICRLEGDGDVILLEDPVREINRITGGIIYTSLGRPNGVIENFKETDRRAGICTSEAYVEDTGYNGLSSFNTNLVNYKDLDDEHGEIELIDGYDTDVDVYQKNRCSKILYRKNILTSASGAKQITQSSDIFGEQQMYTGEWGLTDFRSFASWGGNRYFVDGTKGVVVRKGNNGLFPISSYGMGDYLFDHIIRSDRFRGCFDPKHNSYMLLIEDGIVNFLETVNGWSSFFKIFPDNMVNTMHGVFSFKDGAVYKHDVKEEQCTIYGEIKDVKIVFVSNEYNDAIKVFNSILLESTQRPYKVIFRSADIEAVISDDFFEEKEGLYASYIPMGAGEIAADFVMAGVCPVQYFGARIPVIMQNSMAVHSGDNLYIMNVRDSKPDGPKVLAGKVESLSNGYIEIDRQVSVQAGSLLICADMSQINGEPLRGRTIEVTMYFHPLGRLLIKSVQLDIDESKI